MFKCLPEDKGKFNVEEVEGIRFCWVKTPKYKAASIKRFWSMIMFAFKLCFLNRDRYGIEKPDVIIVSSMPIFSIISGYILKKRLKAKQLIFEVRDLWPLTPMLIGGYTKMNPLIFFISQLERFGYHVSDKIVSVLPNAGSYINGISKNPKKLFHIPNGYFIHGAQEVTYETENIIKTKLPHRKFIVGYTGTIGLANAMEYIVEAAKLLQDKKDIHFMVVGDGYKKEELVKMSEDLENITFIPKVPKSQVPYIIREFNICIISWKNSPLYKHGVSANKYFDYMYAGKPILVAGENAKDPVELSACGLIVPPEKPTEIANGVLRLYKMGETELKEIGDRGRKYVEEHHSYEQLANKYISIFSTM